MSDDKKLNPQEIKAELDWISSSNYESFEKKNPKSRFSEKLADNPLVPIGCLTTATVLTAGLYSMVKRNHRMSQLMMRMRVVAQGATVVALMGGVLYNARKA